LFGNDKAILKTEVYPFLDEVVEILNKNQDMNVTLQGHTDAIGSAEYNQGLSLKRANAVKKYLVNKEIAASRLEAKGSGETEPISSNDTETGRAFNRRVEIHPK
jgi:OOP family OmpA-OmpF porin